MKKRSKKQPVNLTATATLAKQEAPAPTLPLAEAPLPEETEQTPAPEAPEPAAPEAPAPESVEEASEGTPEETPDEPAEVADGKGEDKKQETALDESFCAPGGKLCTCARSNDGLPRIPTAIMVERHGERLRKHEEQLKDLQAANTVILDKMLSLKNQIAVSYGLSLVLAIVVCVLTLVK